MHSKFILIVIVINKVWVSMQIYITGKNLQFEK